MEQIFAPAGNDNLIPRCVKGLRKSTANTGPAACNQDSVAAYLHDVFSSFES
jgi:hypothetical protein